MINDELQAPPSKARLADQRWPVGTVPLVSVRVSTFNHAPFVAACLDGILTQETSFPVEILVHDDASTDDTTDIIKSYEERHPNLFKVIYQRENQYSRGRRPSEFLNRLATGKYFAICEGDDYWTDPLKLQQQVDALDSHPNCALCIHKAVAVHYETKEEWIIGAYGDRDQVIPVKDIITKKRGQIPTASTMITRQAMEEMQDYRSARPWLTVGDIYVHFFGAKRGGAVYIDRAMSVYRYMVPNSWNSRISQDSGMLLKHARARIQSYRDLDKLTQGAFNDVFRAANRRHAEYMLWNADMSYPSRVAFYWENADLFEKRYILFMLPMPVVQLAARLRRAVVS